MSYLQAATAATLRLLSVNLKKAKKDFFVLAAANINFQ